MGWRISLYCIPKKTVEKYRNITQEEWDSKEEIWDELQSDRIKYDTLTDVISSDTENKFSTKLFTNDLEIESDMYFGTISKEQFLNIIEDVMVNHILKWFDGRRIDGPDKLGEAWNDKDRPVYAPRYKSNLWGKWSYDDAMQANQGEWNMKADHWKHKWFDKEKDSWRYFEINLDLNNKWSVSNGYTYEYLIFDLIHILKIFDWENDVMVAIGG